MSSSTGTTAVTSGGPQGPFIPKHFTNLIWKSSTEESSRRSGTSSGRVLCWLSSAIRSICPPKTAGTGYTTHLRDQTTISIINTVRQVTRGLMEGIDLSGLKDQIARGITALPKDERDQTLIELAKTIDFLDAVFTESLDRREDSFIVRNGEHTIYVMRDPRLSIENRQLKKELDRVKADLKTQQHQT